MDKKQFRAELKRIFTGYKRMTPEIERGLRKLGIFVARHRNHVVLEVCGANGRHMVPISSTGGDERRGGLNMASKVMRYV